MNKMKKKENLNYDDLNNIKNIFFVKYYTLKSVLKKFNYFNKIGIYKYMRG